MCHMRFLLPLFALAFLLAGCGRTVTENIVENAIEREGGEDVDVDMNRDGSMNIQTDEGELTTSGKIPDEWPEDVPVPEEATVVYSMSMSPDDEKDSMAVMFSVEDAVSDVAAMYKTKLAGEGWKISGTADMGGTSMVGGEKDGRTVSVIVTAGDEGKTMVNLAIEAAE